MYNVHMKRVTASEARRNWFRLLDEIAGGEQVVITSEGELEDGTTVTVTTQ